MLIATINLISTAPTDLRACSIDFRVLQTGGLEAHDLTGLNFLKSSQVSIDLKKIVLKLDKD
jgi:hypothetical protein